MPARSAALSGTSRGNRENQWAECRHFAGLCAHGELVGDRPVLGADGRAVRRNLHASSRPRRIKFLRDDFNGFQSTKRGREHFRLPIWAAGQEFLNLNFRADNRVYISTEATACTFPRDQPFPVQITLTVTTTSASAQIGVAGSVANYNLPEYPFSFGAVTFYQEAGHAGGPFDVTDIVVTYTAL